MLANKLSILGKDFNVATLKSKFPYKFAITENLFYKGVTPNIENYENISLEEYNNL